ncbi:6543_t:CDS:2 [Diversispora eburnea]|uniref:6543_t:CDS:1 n=1 Tax=Diversispora eburnea TaxID=1213867 RepID=A0A9N8V983_9GLOM|nr:6543_t:CDS:2 [Diversispora eburnea]
MSNNTQPSQMSSTSQPRKLSISPSISSSSRFDISSYSNPLPLISCQQTIPVTPVGRPTPNKRGRKPLATMPLAKKHIQNLNNQRAFRQRRDHYMKNLEINAKKFEQEAKNLGILYSRAQSEIKSLKEKLALFEKQISRYQGNNLCDGEVNMTSSTDIHTISGMIEDNQMNENQIYQDIQKEDNNNSCDVMNETNNYCSDNDQISSPTRTNRIYNQNSPTTYQQECLPLETYAKSCYQSTLNQRNLSSFMPTTTSLHQTSKNVTNNSSMSVKDTINQSLYCGDLCYYRIEDGLQLNDDDTKNQPQLPTSNGRYLKMGRKICVIFPKQVIPNESESSPIYSDCEESGSQWQLQQEGSYYFTQSPDTMEVETSFPTSQSHHNIKWLLENDEQNCDDI